MSTIRRAQLKDIPRILELLVQVDMVHHRARPDIFKGPATKFNAEELKGILADENTPVFASVDENDALEGYAFCEIRHTEETHILHAETTVYIEDICVDEKLRGKHVATGLYEKVLALAEEIGADSVTLNVWAGNGPAMRFYEKLGMTPRKMIMEKKLSVKGER